VQRNLRPSGRARSRKTCARRRVIGSRPCSRRCARRPRPPARAPSAVFFCSGDIDMIPVRDLSPIVHATNVSSRAPFREWGRNFRIGGALAIHPGAPANVYRFREKPQAAVAEVAPCCFAAQTKRGVSPQTAEKCRCNGRDSGSTRSAISEAITRLPSDARLVQFNGLQPWSSRGRAAWVWQTLKGR